MKIIVFAQTKKEVVWALKHGYKLILSADINAQFALFEAGIDPINYLDLCPNKETSKKFIYTGEKFANDWSKQYGDWGLFSRMHWMVFIPELLRSAFVVNMAIKKYQPDKIIIFPKNEQLATVDDSRHLETFYLQKIKPRGIKIQKVFLDKEKINQPWEKSNVKRYFDLFISDPKNIIQAAKVIFSPNDNQTNQADILLHLQRHLLINSLPLIKELERQKITYKIVADSLVLQHRILLQKENIRYTTYEKIFSSNETIDKPSAIVFNSLLKKYKLQKYKEAFSSQFDAIINGFSYQISDSMGKASETVKKVKPKVVILAGNIGRRGLAFAFCARKEHIPCFLWQHSIDTPPVETTKIFDWMFVWGEYWKKWYAEKLDLPLEKFISIGWFHTDKLYKRSGTLKEHSGQKRVLFALSDYKLDNHKIFFIVREVINKFSNHPEFKLIIRPRPGQRFPLGIIKSNNIEWDLGKDADKEINKADLILILSTSFGLQAMLQEKPIVHLKILDCVDELDYTLHGAAIEIHKIDHLIPTVENLLTDNEMQIRIRTGQKKLLKEYAYKIDGKTSSRAVNQIRKFLRGN